MITPKDINNIFRYHEPTVADKVSYNILRESAKQLAVVILELVPPCADQQAALRLLRECLMTANAGIALKGLV